LRTSAALAPIPASSGQIVRHRLNRAGDRQLDRALHTIVLSHESVLEASAPTGIVDAAVHASRSNLRARIGAVGREVALPFAGWIASRRNTLGPSGIWRGRAACSCEHAGEFGRTRDRCRG
jgi:Transposase IS116/IS110/IS902 family